MNFYKMKNYLIILFLITFNLSSLCAQIDNEGGFGTPINAQESSNQLNDPLNVKKPKSLSNKNGFLNSNTNKPKPLDVDKEAYSMSTDNGLVTKKFDYKPSWLTNDEDIKNEYGKAQLLGTFGTKSKSIEILCRDHQYVDGDKVKIILNDEVIIHKINLRADFQSFVIDLKTGRNVIQIEALNQGTSGPNTAHFKVYDDQNNLVTENVWNLLRGVQANLVVIKED